MGVIWKCWEDALSSFAFILSAQHCSMSVGYLQMVPVVDAASLLTR